jgi:predicted pyridoxine 5'-phosphate oxidase superfamily flavin-nucleotide-binding protein
MSTSVFHSGEVAAQALAGVAMPYAAIRDWMPDQHRSFFASLPFLPVTTAGEGGRPVATILTGAPGFIASPDPVTLRISALPDPEDPAAAWLAPGAAVGILGIDLATRRRNRANGTLTAVDTAGLTVSVSQSFGNCPRYIQTRHWHTATARPASVERLPGLDADARAIIAAADTTFVASGTAMAGFDISHRGGHPGFIVIAGETLTIPDFAGNHYFNTFGNLLLDPRAALLFIDWRDGTLLHLQGEAEILWVAPSEQQAMAPRTERSWRFLVTGGWRRPGALPLHWSRDGDSGAEG